MQPSTTSNATKRAVTSANLATTNEFATSNVTSKLFLGGQQRPWMTTQGAMVHPLRRPSNPQPAPGPVDIATVGQSRQVVHTVQNIPPLPSNTAALLSQSNQLAANGTSNGQATIRISTSTSPATLNTTPNFTTDDASKEVGWAQLQYSQQEQSSSTRLGSNLSLAISSMEQLPSTTPLVAPHPHPLAVAPANTTVATMTAQQTPSPSASPPVHEQSRKRPVDPTKDDEDRRPRIRPSVSSLPDALGSPVSQPNTPLVTPTPTAALYIPRLDGILAHLNNQGKALLSVHQRASLLRDACAHDDLFFLCLHQIFTKLTLEPLSAMELAFEAPQMRGFGPLEAILLSNRELPPEAIFLFANFPNPSSNLARSVELNPYISQIRVFLPILSTNWNALREECQRRGFPPSARELRLKLTVPSVVLQRTFFHSILRHLGDGRFEVWQRAAFTYFQRDQESHLQRLKQPDGQEAQNNGTLSREISAFGKGYFELRAHVLPPRPGPLQDGQTPASRSPNTISSPALMNMNATTRNSYSPRTSSVSHPRPQTGPGGGTHQHRIHSLPNTSLPAASILDPTQVRALLADRPPQRPVPGTPPEVPSADVLRPTNFPPEKFNAPLTMSTSQSRYDQNYITLQKITQQSQSGPAGSNLPRSTSGRLPVQGQYTPYINWTHQQVNRFAAPHAQIAVQTATGAQEQPHLSLFPPLGFILGATSNPNTHRMALHQAHIRSPEPIKLNLRGEEDGSMRLYQYFEHFSLPPKFLSAKIPFYNLEFTVSDAEVAELAKDAPHPPGRFDLRPARLLRNGSRLYRLRSIVGLEENINFTPADWNVTATSWPNCCFVSMNEKDLEIRRKTHHGRDLAIDLTSQVRPGLNVLKISVHQITEEAIKCFFVAIEGIRLINHETALQMPIRLKSEEALAAITRSIISADGDDDILLVNQSVSIDLLDPFMSRIFTTPARGRQCVHRECFDLDAFLQTRTSRVKGGPTNPDQWRCPICKKDARPPALVIDEFLLGVREKLKKDGMLETRAILVNADGTWGPKVENEPENGAKKGDERRDSIREDNESRIPTPSATEKPGAEHLKSGQISTPEIIELDD